MNSAPGPLLPLALSAPAVVGVGAAVVLVLMTALWVWHRRLHNAAVVDVGWAISLGFLAALYAVTGAGVPGRRFLVGVMLGLWSVRLASYLLRTRVLGGKPEEGRYQRLREIWSERTMFLFFIGQGLLALVLSLPFWLASNADVPLGWLDALAVAIWLGAWGGETIADRQLVRFLADPANRGKTCRVGLWKWSRHPNYFFEWLMWCAYALLAMSHPWGALGWTAPALMLFLILKVTGIPPTEAQALRSRGDDYRRYQETTSAFVPWPPRAENVT